MQKVRYYLRPRRTPRADGTSLVYLRLTIDKVPQDLNLDYFIPLKNWDFKERKLKAGKGLSKLEALEMQKELEEILAKTSRIWSNAREKAEYLDHESFMKRLSSSDTAFNLISFARDFIEENPKNWAPGTIRIYKDTINWLKEIFGSSITAEELPQLQEKFEKGMCKSLGLNTRKKHHKHTKFFLTRARQAGFNFVNPYDHVSVGTIRGNRSFLNLKELNSTIELYESFVLDPYLQNTLRQFLFSCFTGCRFGDVKDLTRNNIVGDELHYLAEKTIRFEKKIEAPLPDVAKALIPAITDPYSGEGNKLFSMRTAQITNRNLKTIFKKLGINKSLSFHCARHSFGTLYIYLGGDITNLQEIMGHSKLETTQIYVHMAKRMNAKEDNIFDREFASKMRVITKGRAQFLAA